MINDELPAGDPARGPFRCDEQHSAVRRFLSLHPDLTLTYYVFPVLPQK